MAIRRFSTAEPGVKSNKFWDQDTQQGALVPIAQAVGTGVSASMVFSNVPQGYRDLKLIIQGRSTYGSYTTLSVYFNSTGFNGWSETFLKGSNTTASSGRSTQASITYGMLMDTAWSSTASGVFSVAEVDIFNYSSTSTSKTVLARNCLEEGSTGVTEFNVGTWANNAAITYVDVATNGNWFVGSTATLYGIKVGA